MYACVDVKYVKYYFCMSGIAHGQINRSTDINIVKQSLHLVPDTSSFPLAEMCNCPFLR